MAGPALLAAIALLRDQAEVPGQQRLGRHNRIQLQKHFAPESFGVRGAAAPLVGGKSQSLLSQLLPEHSILPP